MTLIELDDSTAKDCGYYEEKYFIVPKLFAKIYKDPELSFEDGLDLPIFAVKLIDGEWNFFGYERQQQVTPLMLACYLGKKRRRRIFSKEKR